MNYELLEKLMMITSEEQDIIDGNSMVQKEIYTTKRDFVIDSHKMLEKGKLIEIRPHTRFIHFPKHRHNFIEIIYMCSGSTTHIINGTTEVILQKGDLLFLNQYVTQEVLPASRRDIAVNFIVLPEFFDQTFAMMEEENVLRDFLIGTLQQDSGLVSYLHVQTKDILPIENLIENMIWSLLDKQNSNRTINQNTMGLLFLHLLNYTDRFNKDDPKQYQQNLVFAAFKYIEDNYKSATLTEFSAQMGLPSYYISKVIKKHSKNTFKEFLQKKRLSQASYLLLTTTIPVERVIAAVGYDNSSYFHRLFKKEYGMTPKTYRDTNQKPI